MTTDRVDIATLEASPVPNQMITIGASAMIGIEPSAMMNGCTTRDTKREYQSSSPSTVPMTLPTTKPSIVSSPVTQVSRNRLPSLPHLDQEAADRARRAEQEGRLPALRGRVFPQAEQHGQEQRAGSRSTQSARASATRGEPRGGGGAFGADLGVPCRSRYAALIARADLEIGARCCRT